MTERRVPMVGLLVALAAGLPFLASLALSLLRPRDGPWPLTVGLGLGAGLLALLGRRGGRHRAGLVVACCSVLVILVWPEIGLRVAGLSFDDAGVVQFGYPSPESMVKLARDPQLFWKLPESLTGVNSEGLLGPEIPTVKPPGTFRLVFLGDSCTAQGYPRQGYANISIELLQQYAGEGRRFEAVNLSLFGYSSYQGRILAERWVDRVQPDVGLVYYGWNDHWQAYGAPDREKAARSGGRGTQGNGVARRLRSSRLIGWLSQRAVAGLSKPLSEPRVSPDDYRSNLASIGERIEHAGGKVVLITAPSSHERLGVPAYLVDEGFAASPEQVLVRHARYNDIVRALARERGWYLLDLQAAGDELEDPHLYFQTDGIHFTPRGLRWAGTKVAEIVYREILPGR